MLGVGFEVSASTAIRAASSCASPFLYPLPFPSSLPLTARGEHGPTICLGEEPTAADRVPNAIVGRALVSGIPLKVADHAHGLEQIVESLARICRRSGEQITKPL